jgi:hypothetical protein
MTTPTLSATVRSIDEVGCNDTRTEHNYVAIVEIAGKKLTLGVTPQIVGGAVDLDWEFGDDDDRSAFEDLPPIARAVLVEEIEAALMPHATIDAYEGGDGESQGEGATIDAATAHVHEHACIPGADCCCDGLAFVASLARVTA